jgi:hypothetical protein
LRFVERTAEFSFLLLDLGMEIFGEFGYQIFLLRLWKPEADGLEISI